MKKFVSIVLTLVLVLGIAIPASATYIGEITTGPMETDAEKLARVQAEVLSGNITNDQDVIEVALAQYAEKVAYCRENGIELDPNESLTITQVIESDASVANTDVVQEIAITGLLITDEEGSQLSAAEALTYIYSENGSDSTNDSTGYVRATTTMTVYIAQDDWGLLYTKVYRVRTVVTETSTAFAASSLQNYYRKQVGGENHIQYGGLISNPVSGTTYNLYPTTSYLHKGYGDGSLTYFGGANIVVNGYTYTTNIEYDGIHFDFI